MRSPPCTCSRRLDPSLLQLNAHAHPALAAPPTPHCACVLPAHGSVSCKSSATGLRVGRLLRGSELGVSPLLGALCCGGRRQSSPAALGVMAAPVPDVDEDECLPEYRHLFSPDLLRDQVAFITGGGSGIGFRIAEIFMRHGCHTVIASRSLPRVSMAAKKLAAATGQRCLPLAMDVRAPPAIMAAVDRALQEFGKINILVNCAAGNFLCPASVLSFNAFRTVMDIDTMGTFNVSRVLYEKFFRDHGGVIVNITATLGFRGQALQVHAGSAKAAVDAMTRHLAVEWGPQHIRVNSLAPGPIRGTEGMRRLSGPMASRSPHVLSSPMRRLGNKTEIAHSTLFLASPLSSYVTGALLVVDGGAWLTFPNQVTDRVNSASAAKL
ncbi:peroxisomal 2,4-dienoyl-CoA reductase [(3E)-enoyl-CoA-producing] [Ochotona curzoniae]|uniref:peroxisomal 2,4-dienoyl-CoA reductase [(3E)-enoyl-CoA-producing] n=1 Tax=Ochotona curzoniae TaxID=130825 RepID=UPI001B34EE4F|nr:peroxisomal 2,4-dienoyl-CoA reductase [(3E)-enoyl-CoA-producing] [Ochotona curzoniae]XP_040829579.1 peroxisomal 2,4-dienoyl-CoA reductase [(3E)-enoyl-CoA-producing] [Ochotona curzoniae]XP_040829580.1 peroxisomal 2,4-dienoyl-CoA reductase [(3E)-enoyl-CoA-producing] [Ochotona curzoniae]XP_040829581.1 peroxisomal 2,4-dienoyl-CoA reductase [(3E)-enoyl-CoA-producing] [Ochotona curzoniae]